jgi:MtN3 and saliva related transmembrane protein
MYNPANLHECEREKKVNRRKFVDGFMIFVGIIASLSSLPQVLKSWQTHDVAGISLTTYILALLSVVAWFLYGLFIKNRPLIYTTAVTILITGIVVIQIITY